MKGLLKNGAQRTFLGPSLTDVSEKQKGIKRPGPAYKQRFVYFKEKFQNYKNL